MIFMMTLNCFIRSTARFTRRWFLYRTTPYSPMKNVVRVILNKPFWAFLVCLTFFFALSVAFTAMFKVFLSVFWIGGVFLTMAFSLVRISLLSVVSFPDAVGFSLPFLVFLVVLFSPFTAISFFHRSMVHDIRRSVNIA